MADTLVSIGLALTLLGSRLPDVHAEPDGERPEVAAMTAEPQWQVPGATVPRGGLGPRQRAVPALGGLGTPRGMTTADGGDRYRVGPHSCWQGGCRLPAGLA